MTTGHICDSLATFGATFAAGEIDNRPLPEPEAIETAVACLFEPMTGLFDGCPLAQDLESMLWGLVNAFHAQINRLDRALDDNERAQARLREQHDGSEVTDTALQEAIDQGRALIDRQNAFLAMFDAAARRFEEATGSTWQPRHGSRLRTPNLTAAMIDSRDFERSRRQRWTEDHLPPGPYVVFSGGSHFQDVAAIWQRLDRIQAKHPAMSRIAQALGISEQGVRKWRRTGIPKGRHQALSKLLADSPVPVAATGRAQPVRMLQKASHPSERNPQRATPSGMSRNQPTLDDIADEHAAGDVRVLIARRHVDHTRRHVEWAAARTDGLPPSQPVSGYGTRLALLFALDFPILTMAFAAVAQVSPIVAAGSAVALSLFLVLGAHALGGPLRELASYLPTWCCSLVTAVVIIALLVAIIAVTIDLRIKGFDVGNAALQIGSAASIFDDPSEASETPPPAFQWSIARAAALVTVIATIFGIGWSYRQHGPQADFARAERTHQQALRRYARAARKISRKTGAAIVILLLTGTWTTGRPADATTACDGPSVLALIDTTTAYDDQDRGQIMPAIDRMVRSLEPGVGRTPSHRSASLVIDPTRAGVDAVSRLIREELTQRGELTGPAIKATVLQDAGLTRTERATATSYKPGQIVRFMQTARLRDQPAIASGAYLTVEAIEGADVRFLDKSGREVRWEPRSDTYPVTVFEPMEKELRIGDHIRWTENNDAIGAVSGRFAKVVSVDTANRRIEIEHSSRGRHQLDLSRNDHRHLDYGYAVTIQRAQGATAYPILNAPSYRVNTIHLTSAYVGISRAPGSPFIVTDSRDRLIHSLSERVGLQSAALDQARTTAGLVEQVVRDLAIQRRDGAYMEPTTQIQRVLERGGRSIER